MGQLVPDVSISLDGFLAGPSPTLEAPLGEGGGLLREWAFATEAFRRRHGLGGGRPARTPAWSRSRSPACGPG
jgi:hypothetical protein